MNCKCGKPSIARGLCRSCYYKERNKCIKNGTWGNGNKNAAIELSGDEAYANTLIRKFYVENKYYANGEMLLHTIDSKEDKAKLARGVRSLMERGLTHLEIVPSKQLKNL